MNRPTATFGHGCEQLRAKGLATLYGVLSRGPTEIRVVGVLPIGHSRTTGGARRYNRKLWIEGVRQVAYPSN